MTEPLLIVAFLLSAGFLISLVQDAHMKKPFLSIMGFRLVSFGAFCFFLLGSLASLKFLFGF
jgi:hypothetical protein